MWWMLWSELAMAQDPAVRLVLVGDTGKDTQISPVVSSAIAGEMTRSPTAQLVALGDLFYTQPPADQPDCAAQVAARYRSFFGAVPVGRTHAVAGNHDVATPETHLFSPEAHACSQAAFRDLGWLGADEALATRTRAVDAGGLTVDLVLVEGLMFREDHPALPDLRPDADWQIVATHYLLAASFGKEAEEIGQFYGLPVGHAPDLWVNGHAHQLEGRATERTFAVTSGAGMQMRTFDGWVAKGPSAFAWVRCDKDKPAWCDRQAAHGRRPSGLLPYAEEAGGYVILDLWPRVDGAPLAATITPVVCRLTGCEPKPPVSCVRRPDGRGVICGG